MCSFRHPESRSSCPAVTASVAPALPTGSMPPTGCARCNSTRNFRGTAQLPTNFVLQGLVAKLPVHCRNGVREGPRGTWEADPEGCPMTMKASEMEAHEASCPHKPVPCRWQCGEELPPRELAAHFAECADIVVRCTFVGCSAMHRRGDAEKHQKEAAELHARCEREDKRQLLSKLGRCNEIVNAAKAIVARATKAADVGLLVAALQLCPHREDASQVKLALH